MVYREVSNCTAFLGHPMSPRKGEALLVRLPSPRLLWIQVSSVTSTSAGRWKALCLPSAAGQEEMGII